jgi:cyanophycin synthetase
MPRCTTSAAPSSFPAELIDSQLNTDPRRGETEDLPLETIRLEREPAMRLLLQRQGLQGDSVPEAGKRVLVQRNGNMNSDCTHEVHPEVAAMAERAGLDGVDLRRCWPERYLLRWARG